jgi:hypothetical protein
MDYLSIANSGGMWVACAAIILVVIYQSVKITVLAFRAGKEIGLSRSYMFAAFRTGLTTAIVPSIAILLGLAVLIPRLGIPFPWMRLAVVGSVSYELIAAGAAANELGLEGLSSNFTPEVFATAVWTMSMGVLWCLLIVAFFTPKIKQLKDKIGGGDQGWMGVLSQSAFFGATGYLVAQPMVKGGPPLFALIGGFLFMVLMGVLIKVGKQNWLKEWALAISIIGGMAAAGLSFAYLGIGG